MTPVTFFLLVLLAASGHAQGTKPGSGRPLPSPRPETRPSGPRSAGSTPVLSAREIDDRSPDFLDTLDNSDYFGRAVAVLGDLDDDGVDDVAVGAPGNSPGAVWILFLDADGSVKSQREIDPPGDFGILGQFAGFGSSLAAPGDLDGDGSVDLIAGTPGDDDGGVDRGAVWVLFLAPDGSVRARQKISALAGGFGGALANGDGFGTSLAAVGDHDGDGVTDLAVGAWGTTDYRGAVWILFLEPDGTVDGQQKIAQSTGGFTGPLDVGDVFGNAVAALGDLDGDGIGDLAVGAMFDDVGSGAGRRETGSVWILFLRADGTVKAQQRINDVEGGFGAVLHSGDRFGSALASPGDLDGDGIEDLVVGQELAIAPVYQGAFWVLFLAADGTVASELQISNGLNGFTGELEPSDLFGCSLACLDLEGDGGVELAVGALGDDDGGGTHGALWLLDLRPDGTVASSSKISDAPGGIPGTLERYDHFGSALVSLGDLDRDGELDLAVGAEKDDGGGRGALWLLSLDGDRVIRRHRQFQATDGFTSIMPRLDSLGSSLARLGDLDRDGITELVVGARGGRVEATPGSVWILFLAADGAIRSRKPIAAARGGFTGALDNFDFFGTALAPIGDLDGDGVLDLAVGADGDDDGGPERGAVWILFLRRDGTVRDHQKIASATGGFAGQLDDGDRFGCSLAAPGDLDGDGAAELVVGAEGDDDGPGPDRGAVWILHLRSDGTVREEAKISAAAGDFAGTLHAGDAFGSSLASLGDSDGDGLVELVVGAEGDDDGGSNRGAAWILFLARDGSVREELKISATAGGFTGELANEALFGCSLGALGDLDGDGLLDVAVGAKNAGSTPFWEKGELWLLSLDGIASIGFDGADSPGHPALENGRSLETPGEFGRVLALSSSGANRGPAIFDSRPHGPNDPSQDRDLLVSLGNLVILQNSQVPTQSVPGIFDRPNDDQDGGTLVFELPSPVRMLSLDLSDIDQGATQSARVTLRDERGAERVFTIPAGWTEDLVTHGPPGWRTLDLTSLDPQPGFAAAATASESAGFEAKAVIRLEVLLGSSGGLDNLRWDPHPAVAASSTSAAPFAGSD